MLWEGIEAQGPSAWGCETRYLQLGFLQVPAFARAVPLLSRVFADFHSFCPPLFRVDNGVTTPVSRNPKFVSTEVCYFLPF